MTKQSENSKTQYVRKETFWLVTILALAVGFFGGVMFSVFKSDTVAPPGRPPAAAPKTAAPKTAAPDTAAPDRANMIAALEKETSSNPDNITAWIELGNSYFDTKQYEKSIGAYRKALEINPDNTNVLTDLGIMYRRSGQPQKAVEAFNRAIEIDPKHESSRLNLGIVYLHDLNDFEGAIKAWEELLAVNPLVMSPTGQSVDKMVQQLKKQGNPMGGAMQKNDAEAFKKK